MKLPRVVRSFFVRDHEKGVKLETLVEGSLCIFVEDGSTLLGEFPRRVQLGDELALILNRRILSPANGVVRLEISKDNKRYLKITQDGSLEPVHKFREVPKDRNTFFTILNSRGVYSLDFSAILLSDYLESFRNTENSVLILTPLTRFNQPDFRSILENEYKKELELLIFYLEDLFPNREIRLIWEDFKTKLKYPIGIPEYFCEYKAGYSILGKNPRDKGRVFFMGGETVYHLIRALFYDLPFTRRHLTVHCVDRRGRLDGKERVFFLSNGQSFDFLRTVFSRNYRSVCLNHYMQKPVLLANGAAHYFDIFRDSHIVFYLESPRFHSELACTECMECNSNCPTGASPIGIVSRLYEFRTEYCIDCGLCTLYCPSGIDLRKRIAERVEK